MSTEPEKFDPLNFRMAVEMADARVDSQRNSAKTIPSERSDRILRGRRQRAGTHLGAPPDKEALITLADELWKIVEGAVHEDNLIIEKLFEHVDQTVLAGENFRGLQTSLLGEYSVKKADEEPDPRKRLALLRSFAEKHKEMGLVSDFIQDALDLSIFASTPEGQIWTVGLARWADNGYPQVVMGHKFAAALLCSTVSNDVLELVEPPWDGFVIEVPNDLLLVHHNTKDCDVSIRRIVVTKHKNVHVPGKKAWMYVAQADQGLNLWRFGVDTKDLLPPHLDDMTLKYTDPTMVELSDRDERIQALIGRLIVNVCLAMNDPTLVKKVGPAHKDYEANAKKRASPEPTARTFQVGKPVILDFREKVRDYVLGRSKERVMSAVQWMVCGHFANQPHGPRNSLRKQIWREPHWSGAADAPILVRPHVLEKK